MDEIKEQFKLFMWAGVAMSLSSYIVLGLQGMLVWLIIFITSLAVLLLIFTAANGMEVDNGKETNPKRKGKRSL